MKNTKIILGLVVVLLILIGGGAYYYTQNYKSSNNNSNTKIVATPIIDNALVKTIKSSSLGNYLSEPNGLALYTYNQDGFNKSNCQGSCLSLWPAYLANSPSSGLPDNFSVFKRSDGKLQYSYKGKPLYTFSSDKPYQATGNGIGGFYLARP